MEKGGGGRQRPHDGGWRWWVVVMLVGSIGMGWTGVASGAEMVEERDAGEAATTPRWHVEVGVGVESTQSRDDLGSPLRYEGRGYPMRLRGDHIRQRTRWYASVQGHGSGVNGGHLRAISADGPSMAQSGVGDLKVGGAYRWRHGERLRPYIGGRLRTWAFFRRYTYSAAQIGSVETWEATLSADMEVGLEAHRGPWSGALEAGMALGGWAMRPNHALRGDRRLQLVEQRRHIVRYGQWVGPRQLQMGDLQARLQWAVTDRWGLSGTAYIRATAVDDGRSTRAYQRGIIMGSAIAW